MNRKIYLLVVMLAAILLFPAISASDPENKISLTPSEQNWLDQNYIVRVRVGQWPPFQMIDGGFKGIAVDYITKIFTIHGIDYEFVSGSEVPWKTALENIRDHQVIDLILTAKITEKRKKEMVFSDEYLMLPWVIFNRQGAEFVQRIEDLNGKLVSVPDGYVMHGLLEKNYPEIRLKLFSQGNAVEQCLAALAKGEVDAYIGNLTVGSYIILKNGYTNLRVAAPTPFGSHNQAMAIRDDWPELAAIINKTLKSFTPEVHAAIRNKWLSVRYEHGIRPKDVARWVIVIAGILMAVILFVVFWNRSLTREISERRRVEKELQNSENRYRSLCNASFEGVLIIEDGLIIEANDVMARILGYTIPELIGKEAVEIVAPDVREDVRAKILAGYEQMYETVGLTKQGAEFPIEVHARMFTYKNRQVRCSAIRDLSERHKTRDALRESENKFRAVATGAQDAIIMTNGQGNVTFWNNAAERIFQYTENEALGKNPHDLIAPSLLMEKFKEKYPKFQLTGKGNAVGRTTELTALKKNGTEFPVELSLSAIQIKGQWCGIAVVRDITERKKMEAELRRLATTDALTNVDNRRSFMDKAAHELRRTRRYGNPFSLIIIDIDYFKAVNDTHGHQTGDLVLQQLATEIRGAIRESDLFGRLGGEEFAVVMIETEPNVAMMIGERIRSRIEVLKIDTEKETVTVTISLGLASFREGDDFETISKRADQALYEAKENGRNCLISR